ncbi:hypothetical protein [Flavobacterium hercynium]|uniref:Uncharacterized protein n=1 Tax=Flavobacterium hercynium TaxID=387094 RepID=A0A226GRG9_9FLAO|nr:hypothetical protein [Flavobacterium hercynium]OXA83950.1 hypothetical protein B0A66_21600 [Flavobacterium hercynium]SMP16750.1 hypothetical protein SAMN06265346_10564 [Flavobacterium hercynium]
MYSRRSGLILGFHGCDKAVRDKIVCKKGEILKPSENDWDWLGHGIYFWENNHERVLQFAHELKDNPPKGKENLISEPAVLGVIIDLGYCLDLLDSKFLDVVKVGYEFLCNTHKNFETVLPVNIINKKGELLRRNLDCAVIQTVHQMNLNLKKPEYDSVRGVFFEGEDLYENAGFKEKNHIQIAIRNQNCIKGFFIPREFDE